MTISTERLQEMLAENNEGGALTFMSRREFRDLITELLASRSGVEGREAVGAIADIAAERRRQVEAEGWTPEHDDEHDRGEMARAAACYALCVASPVEALRVSITNAIHWMWPWGAQWWKPADHRRNLIKAGALIAAEIDRLDRRTLKDNTHEA